MRESASLPSSVSLHRDEDVDESEQQQQKPLSTFASPRELLVLECAVGESAERTALMWRRLREAGLGPFVFLPVRRSAATREGVTYVVERPADLPWPPVMRRHVARACARSPHTPLQMQCVDSVPLETQQQQQQEEEEEEDPWRDVGVVLGPALCVNASGTVIASPCIPLYASSSNNAEKDDDDDTEEKDMCVNGDTLLVLLLRQASAWSVALLRRCGALADNGLASSAAAAAAAAACVRRRVGLAVQAVCYLQQALTPQADCEGVEDLMGLVVGWARVMHNTLVSPAAELRHRVTEPRSHKKGDTVPTVVEHLSAVSGRDIQERSASSSPVQKHALPWLHPSKLAASSSVASPAGCVLGGGNEAECNNEGTQPTGAPNLRNKRGYPSFLCICSEVLEEAFHLQTQHVEQQQEEQQELDTLHTGVMGMRGIGAPVTPAAAARVRPGDDHRGKDVHPLKCSSITSSDTFLPSLIHRLVVLHESSPSSHTGRQLSAIARGDLFPSRAMLQDTDLLQRRLCGATAAPTHLEETATTVCFYDLDPHQLMGSGEATASHFAASAIAAAAGVVRNAGHPCYLYITQTDIILVSAFNGGYAWQTPASSPFWKRGEAASNGGNANNPDSGGDIPSGVKQVLLVPRVSLTEVQQVSAAGDGAAAVPFLRLQTRSCRRVWLGFSKETAMRAAYAELLSSMKSTFGNRLLASAQRPWRMAALALTAGDVLPSPHTPFYQQALRNILVALADIETRREQRGLVEQQQQQEKQRHGWWLYSAGEEYVRLGVPERQWRLTNVNACHACFPTYPACFMVPNCLSDETLVRSADLRMRGRVEALTYYYSPTAAAIVRASQPVAVQALYGSSLVFDTIEAYRRACGLQMRFFDLRSPIHALGNTFAGGGFKISGDQRFCSLVNIHGVRNSFEELCANVLDSNPTFQAVMKAVRGSTAAAAAAAAGAPNATSSTPSLLLQHRKSAEVWSEQIHALLRTARDAARLVAGLPEEETLAPATTRTVASAAIATGVSSGMDAAAGASGSNDRSPQGSSILHVWMHAFSAINYRGGNGSGSNNSSTSSGGGGSNTFNAVQQQQQTPPSSYSALQSRKVARLVMVNCSDGWDRTSQVCALAELLLDPYYRTVEGFLTLLEKEFVSFGHPCLTRSSTLRGQGDAWRGVGGQDTLETLNEDSSAPTSSSNTQSSPIILQFLNAVQQLVRLYPHCFEFTETFLLLIVDVLHAGIVGSFAVNCERDVERWDVEQKTLSLSQFFAVLLATTLPVGSENHTVPAAAADDDKEDVEDDVKRGVVVDSGSSPPVVPLQMFFRACGGGASLHTIGWCTAAGSKPRRLAVSYDAMCFSGLLNPHFSFADNKLLLGPLVDPVRLSQLMLWEEFFLRYSFWNERCMQLRRYGEQSASTFCAAVMASVRSTVLSPSLTIPMSLPHLQQQQLQKQREKSSHIYPAVAFTDASDSCDAAAAAPGVGIEEERGGLAIASRPVTKTISLSGTCTPTARFSSISLRAATGGGGGGGGGGRMPPRTLPRAASYATLSVPHESQLQSSQRHFTSLFATPRRAAADDGFRFHHSDDVAPGRPSSLGSSPGAESAASLGAAAADATRNVQQGPGETSTARVRSYNTLLTALDDAYDQ